MTFDWKKPDYGPVWQIRLQNLDRIRERPGDLPAIREYYRQNPWQFIDDWGVTFDPRNVERGLPALVPFLLFPKQIEWCKWVVGKWKSQRPGLCEKSRDMGISWLSVALASTLCMFHDGLVIGFGSRTADHVDKPGTLKALLPKARMFLQHIPEEFLGPWEAWREAPNMRISFPRTGSLITGEGGDEIGRGDRSSLFFVDEAAHIQRPELVDAALSQTTNCRIDMSSVRGMANPFARKRWDKKAAKDFVFIFDWRDDPRKDDAWYRKQCEDLDPVVVAQEIDRDYSASVRGVVIPGKWVRAAIDAKQKLGIAPSGEWLLAYDPADEGDNNAAVGGQGTEISICEDFSGKGSDTFASTEYVFEVCDKYGIRTFRYDSDGLGAGVRGDARIINERRASLGRRVLTPVGFRGSGAVVNPNGVVEGTIGRDGDPGRKNEDFFANAKAQGWWNLRTRFQNTWRWIEEGIPCPPDEIISISSAMPNWEKLVAELSQATYQANGAGKIVINKKPNGMKSPNMADGVMMRFASMGPPPVNITGQVLEGLRRAGRRR